VSRLVELAGPPGAGKSSVFGGILARAQNVTDAPVLLTREYAPELVVNVPAILGTLIRHRALRRLTRERLRTMVYLRSLPRLVERCASGEANVLVFDQGPLYLLSQDELIDERLDEWREEVVDAWASLLDAVVWLDAPDAVLAERIDGRTKWHRLQGQPAETAIEVIAGARGIYEGMISRMEAQDDGPTMLRFDTSRISADDVADAIIKDVGGFSVAGSSGAPPEPLPVRGRA